jgi:DNA-binding NtrC family response regulator
VTKPLVVCIDDNHEVLAAVVRTLRALPIELLSTTDPETVLEWVASRDVAVLVSDYDMPVMNGVDLIEAARRIRPETVRILLTGPRAFQTAVDGINRGEVFRYISKPVDLGEFRLAVTGAVARHAELVRVSGDLAIVTRRARIAGELEAQYPDLTQVERCSDGAYEVPPTSREAIAGLGLDVLFDVRRQS